MELIALSVVPGMLSIVVPVYNSAPSLRKCLDSCLAQSYRNLEIIVIDGGSQDDSVQIIRLYEGRLAFWVSEKDDGIYDAWNKGLRRASGEWIAFMGADDYWASPQAVERLMSCALHPQVNLITARLEKLDHGEVKGKVFGMPWSAKRIRMNMNVAHAGMPHHRSLFEKHGLYDERFRIAGDYEFLLRASSDIKAAYLDETIAYMGGGGASSTQLRCVRDESFRALWAAPAAGPFWAGVFWLRFVLRHGLRLLAQPSH